MDKKLLRNFEINILRLENRDHIFDFDINQGFFELFPESLTQNGSGKVKMALDKSETMLQLHFDMDLTIELTCDLSLRDFFYPIKTHHELIVKFGEEEDELSEDIIVIRKDASFFNVASVIYEFITLQVPMKKIHPELADDDRPELVYQTIEDDEEKEEEIDPRWELLKKLKNNK